MATEAPHRIANLSFRTSRQPIVWRLYICERLAFQANIAGIVPGQIRSQIATRLNGELLYDVDTREVTVPEGQNPFEKRSKSGFIGLQRHAPDGIQGDAYAWFKNIWIKPVAAD